MSDSKQLPIGDATWQRLVKANREAVAAGWAQSGVFATGVGPDYRSAAPGSILYVGKSAGPLGDQVGYGFNQAESAAASRTWMIERRNLSPFWQTIDAVDRSRRGIAWTNVCKMDRRGGGRPPNKAEWAQVREVCRTALAEEIRHLSPATVLFATSDDYRDDVRAVLSGLGYCPHALCFDDGRTSLYATADGARAIMTRHPQGWPKANRDQVVALANGKSNRF